MQITHLHRDPRKALETPSKLPFRTPNLDCGYEGKKKSRVD